VNLRKQVENIMTTLVIAEHDNAGLKAATLNTVTAAARLGADIHVLVAGAGCGAAAEAASRLAGVAKVKVADAAAYAEQGAENVAALLVDVIKTGGYSHVLAPATTFGKNILPRVAALLDVAQISEIVAIESADTFVRPIYAGNALATVKSSDAIKVITVRTTGFDPAAASGGSAAVESVAAVADSVRSSGDYTLRATWQSSDEIGRLITAFNDMLDQLDRSRRVEQELAAQARAAAAQRQLLEAVPIPLMVTATPHHEVLHTNAQAQAWLDGRLSDPWVTGLTPAARVRFFQMLADTGAANEFEVLWHGEKRTDWALLSARCLRYQDQDAVLTAFTPIGRIKHMEERLELWAKVFEASSESILITDANRQILTVNRAFCRNTAYERIEVIGEQPNFLRSDRHPHGFYDDLWQSASVRGSWQGEMWIRRKTGEAFPVWAVLNAVRDDDARITHYIATWFDISARKADEQRISHLAQHDVLTDLPNRALCVERLRVALQQAERHQRRVAVLFIDLDRFKIINDSVGHLVGDELLKEVSARISGRPTSLAIAWLARRLSSGAKARPAQRASQDSANAAKSWWTLLASPSSGPEFGLPLGARSTSAVWIEAATPLK